MSKESTIGIVLLLLDITIISAYYIISKNQQKNLLKLEKMRQAERKPLNMKKIETFANVKRCFVCGNIYEVKMIFGNPPCPSCSERTKLSKTIPGERYKKIERKLGICNVCGNHIEIKDRVCIACNTAIDFKDSFIKAIQLEGMTY
ncbi:MAG: hypothetical protein INQ03_18455 [Candidatus Heimdallarchaeota archaeon]|nr:hypothetical protein [Candidatus Heimdallarchaeota archaeon]